MTTIKGFSKYLIYENGDIYSKYYNKLMSPQKNKYNYLCLNLKNDEGKCKSMRVHRLVALAYIPNLENKREVDHIDQNKTNNHVSNLRWATRSENMQNIKQVRRDNTLGEKNIYLKRDKDRISYVFQKNIPNQKRIYKRFKTLEEAIEYRDNYLQNNNI
jgi:hypothetical protein